MVPFESMVTLYPPPSALLLAFEVIVDDYVALSARESLEQVALWLAGVAVLELAVDFRLCLLGIVAGRGGPHVKEADRIVVVS